jgi:predicted metalloprotease
MHIGIGGAVILLVLSLIFHKNFFALLGGGDQTAPQQQSGPVQETPGEHRNVQFVSFVLDDAQKTWEQTLPGYRHAKLDLFRDAIQSACGFAQSASGPFYCPNDEKVYIDLGFYDELRQKFGAPGDFAQAYVIAHEIGHHVQKLQGIEQQVHQAMENGSSSDRSALSVRLELQADCYAGVWGHSTQQRGIIDNADIEQGLNAAAAIGDDRLQRMAGRTVNPERFTHGSSQQRVEWFKRGLQSGRVEDCDTFRQ